MSVIECTKLSKRFRKLNAVDTLDLQINEGDVFGFLGPNGAGKSTTLRMMVGLIRPSKGSLKVFGYDCWKQHTKAMADVGAFIESPAFHGYLSGRDNLKILTNIGRNCSDNEIDRVLDVVGLLNRGKDKVRTYSQGMRQRLAIALAIAGNPRLVLLDEPTNGLDPQGMKEIRELITHLAEDLKMTIFLSSHLLHEVEQVCSKIAVINKGKLIASGKVSELLYGNNSYNLLVDSKQKVEEVLEKLDWAKLKSAEENNLNIALSSKDSAELNKALVNGGVSVFSLERCKTSLEDMYLKLMDESNA
jgi:ABC-2 type transport system ATP-binding protein